MANCINYNCDEEIGEHTLNDCGYERQGGASAILLLECGETLTDPSSGSEINALIAAGGATLITEVNVSYDRASAVLVDSNIPNRPQRVVNYDRTGTLIDRNVNAQNTGFYDKIFTGRQFGGAVIFEAGNEDQPQVKFINSVLTFNGSDRVPNTTNEFQDYEGSFQWKSLTMPSVHSAPVGVL
jgi:hypothetical protein